jgi:hypothetical protein
MELALLNSCLLFYEVNYEMYFVVALVRVNGTKRDFIFLSICSVSLR